MERREGRIAAGAGFCLLWALILFVTAATVYNLAGDGALMAEQMRRYAPPENSGLPDEQYPEMGRMITDYLTGRNPVFQYSYSGIQEETIVCFQPHEAEHMADCRGLIHLAGVLRWITGGAALILTGTGIVLRKHRRRFASGMLAGFYLAAAVFTGILIWGVIDFDGLFTAFHRGAFTNDGWLLNPGTDMLIRLMPISFFVSMGIRVLQAILAITLLSCAAAIIIGKTDIQAERDGRASD